MKVLVINSGSSSIKYQLFNMENEIVLAKGTVGRIGINKSYLEYENCDGVESRDEMNIPDHRTGIKYIINSLLDEKNGVLTDIEEISAVGHRVSHGGKKFSDSVLVDEQVIKQIDKMSELAPLHNPHNLTGIKVCGQLLPGTSQVAVFDTGFHQQMPEYAYLYALPYKYYEKYDIRRYGFHGISHKYIANRAGALVNSNLGDLKIISCHLGSGASITAVDSGVSVDNSMGFTPLEGLVMGTRCGDLDPAIISFLAKKEDLDVNEVYNIMNNESGLLGISEISSDVRDIEEAAKNGNKKARIALDVFSYRVKKYIGAYMAAMGGVDVLAFAGGIGENDSEIRRVIIEDLEFAGVLLDKEANGVKGEEVEITVSDSPVKAFVIPTNEELVIARDTERLVTI